MGGLCLAHVSNGLARRRLILSAWLRGGQRLADKAYLSARFSGFLAEYVKIQGTSGSISLDINRSIGVINKF